MLRQVQNKLYFLLGLLSSYTFRIDRRIFNVTLLREIFHCSNVTDNGFIL